MKITEKEVRYVADLANLTPHRRRSRHAFRRISTAFWNTSTAQRNRHRRRRAHGPGALRSRRDRHAARRRARAAAWATRPPWPTPRSPARVTSRFPKSSSADPRSQRMDIPSLTIDQREGGPARAPTSAPPNWPPQALRFAEAENPKTNAYLRFSPERALAAARRVDETLARGEDPGPLAGVPVAVKDVILTKGVAHHLRLEAAGRLRSALRRHRRDAPGSRPAASLSARPTATSSPWARPTRTRPSARCAIPWRPTACPAAPAAVRRRPSRRAPPWWRSAPIPAAPSASPRRSAASWA